MAPAAGTDVFHSQDDPPFDIRIPYYILLLCLLAGCGARKEYYAADLEIDRAGWDTLRVDVAFAWRSTIGGEHRFVPEETSVHVFDAEYRTIFEGAAREPFTTVAVPDAQLGDRERILVEVCGRAEGRQICLQRTVQASPKRLSVDQAIEYPLRGDYGEGRYDLSFRAERQHFEGETWEPIATPSDVRGYLLAWVQDARQEPVKVPFTGRTGTFDLARHANYKDFKYHLDTRLLDGRPAEVRFELYAGLGERADRLTSVRKAVAMKTREERVEEVRHLLEQAASRLVDALGTQLGDDRVVVYVDDWTYEPVSQSYRASLDVAWRGRGRRGGSFFRERRFEIEGRLEIAEDGSRAQFYVGDASEHVLALWEERVGADVLSLGPLEPYSPPDSTDFLLPSPRP